MLDGTPKAYQWFDELYCAYTYPLLRRTLLNYQKYLMKSRNTVDSDKFFWTWVQCHVQQWYIKKYLNPTMKWMPSRYPDAKHIRLLTYCALAAGSKGLIYFTHLYYRDDYYGTERYVEAGIIGCEAEKALQDGKHANAYSTSRNAQRIIRASVYASWQKMRPDKTLQGEALAVHEVTAERSEQNYYLMPLFYEKRLIKGQ